MRITFLLSIFGLVPGLFSLAGAQIQPVSTGEIIQNLQKLNTIGSVLYVAAHPDDENTRLLTYLARERKLRTGYLSITRGDGGQNLIGKEQGDALGVIRTQELLAARRTDGAEQFFTRAVDFGYSKTPDETLNIWQKDSILADVVWVIRRFKPDLIVCRFPTTGEGGHGHHTASAILAEQAFDAAADPTRFPGQLLYTSVWQAKGLYWNTFNFGTTNTTAPDQLTLDVGGYSPLTGKSNGEIASESRSNHKSQGFGSARSRGEQIDYFKQLKGEPVKTSLFEGLINDWSRFPSAKTIAPAIDQIIERFKPLQPEASLPDLIKVYRQIQALDNSDSTLRYWKGQKTKEAEWLILACSGLWLEAFAGAETVVAGHNVNITAQAICRSQAQVTLKAIQFPENDTLTALGLKPNQLYSFKHSEMWEAKHGITTPYWLAEKSKAGYHSVRNKMQIGQPENEPAARVSFQIRILDLDLVVSKGIVYKHTDPVKGEVYQPLQVLPPVTFTLDKSLILLTDSASRKVKVTVRSHAPNQEGVLGCIVPLGWKFSISAPDFALKNPGDEAVAEITITPGKTKGMQQTRLVVGASINARYYGESLTEIEYDHIPHQVLLKPVEIPIVKLNLKKRGKRIGYIEGAGDEIPACLRLMDYEVVALTDETLAQGHLAVFDAIVTGIRAYNTNDRLQVYHARLMEYVKQGGNLVVQYNTNNRIGPLLAKIGPQPFTISRERVTNENAEVRLLEPTHPAFNQPNRIVADDFAGWVQERGIYFVSEADAAYKKLIELNDPNEKPTNGSLIVAPYGKGNFVYTGLAFFRQLPAGVPGAYRLFANLLSLPPNP